MKRSPALRAINRPIVDLLGAVIARGQADGTIRADVAPIDVHMRCPSPFFSSRS